MEDEKKTFSVLCRLATAQEGEVAVLVTHVTVVEEYLELLVSKHTHTSGYLQ